MTPTVTTDTNAYWEAVRGHINPTGSLWGTPEVGSPLTYNGDLDTWARTGPHRHDHVRRYSWTITDPDTVAFVAHWSTGRMVDPMAGTGWWAHALAGHGVDVLCSDIAPGTNHWHKDRPLWVPVTARPAVDAVAEHPDRALFLAWPPYDQPDGVDTVRAYQGGRIIAITEGDGGCIGDDGLFTELGANWVEVAEHVPVQWFGIHDRITVYDRR